MDPMKHSSYARKILKKAHALGPDKNGQIVILEQFFDNLSITKAQQDCLISYMKQKGYICERKIVSAKGITLVETSLFNFKFFLTVFFFLNFFFEFTKLF